MIGWMFLLLSLSPQTMGSWCWGPQPSQSQEQPAWGPDPQSSFTLWVYHSWCHMHFDKQEVCIQTISILLFICKLRITPTWTVQGRSAADKGHFTVLSVFELGQLEYTKSNYWYESKEMCPLSFCQVDKHLLRFDPFVYNTELQYPLEMDWLYLY